MNERISDTLAQHVAKLPYITRAAGCVQEAKLNVKGGKIKTFPVCRVAYSSATDFEGDFIIDETTEVSRVTCGVNEPYLDLIPNDKETGIAYFEDLGVTRVSGNARQDRYKGKLRLVVWLNLKKIWDAYSTSDFSASVLSQLPHNLQDTYIHGGTLNVSGILPKRPSPFDKYSYNEAEKQYLLYPYDYFAIDFEYMVFVPKGCPVNIVLNPATC